ncbi:MAG: hypothetical protein ACLGGX_10135 [Bdellovibrionia bacterium]
MSKYIALFLVFFYLLGAVATPAPKCHSVFTPKVSDVVSELPIQLQSLFGDNSKAREVTLPRSRQLRKLLQRLDNKTLRSEMEVEIAIAEISKVLFPHNESVNRFLVSKSERQISMQQRLFSEVLMREGITQLLPLTENSKTSLVRQVLSSRKWEYLMLPFVLPSQSKVKIPRELLEKVVLDGFDKHQLEIEPFLARQNKHENYMAFRSLYAPTVLGTILVIQVSAAYDLIERQREERVNNLVRSIQQQQETILSDTNHFKDQLFNETLEQVIVDFRNTWGEEPTSEEMEKIRIQIQRELFKK